MRRFILYSLTTIFVYFIQTALLPSFALGGIVPNLLIIFTVAVGIIRGKRSGCCIGFVFGLLMDALFSVYFGSYSLILTIIGYLSGCTRSIIYEEDMTLPILIIGLADIFYGCVIYLFSFLPRGRTNFLFYFTKIILPETIYTLILSVFLYRLISWIIKKLDKGSEKINDQKNF